MHWPVDAMLYIVDSGSFEELVKALDTLCRETGYFCYKPIDSAEPIVSMAWAETLQYISELEECSTDVECSSKALDMFGTVLQKALSESYIFAIDLEKVKRALSELSKTHTAASYGLQLS